jgi:peptide/nickel transport system permease protein
MKATSIRRWVGVLVALHLPIVLAGFFAPYAATAQHRRYPFAPPTRVHFRDAEGQWSMRPFYYDQVSASDMTQYIEDRSRAIPIRFLLTGDRYRFLGLFNATIHLFGGEPGVPVFLFGSDGFGRDQLARWLAGGQISILAGLLAALAAVGLGTVIGTVAGYFGGKVDRGLTRLGELFTALPWMYLLIAIRASLPLRVAPEVAFAIVVLATGAAGWVRPGRLVRALVMSARERTYVLSARGFGAPDRYLLRHHVLPSAYGAILTQAALALPQFVVAEVVLSFLGLGVAEPLPSWGNLLMPLQQYYVLVSCWWMFIPAVLSTAVFFVYYRFADAVHMQLGAVAL